MRYSCCLILALLLTSVTNAQSREPEHTLFIIGDSTVKNSTEGLQGWGDLVADYFNQSKLRVVNRARGGRSSRTFQTEGLWDQILKELRPGDFVLMQFGHNDGAPLDDSKARGSIPGVGSEVQSVELPATNATEVVHTFGWYMRKYVADAKARGAVPIILSPVPRNIWIDGKLERAAPTYGGWAAEVARSEKTFFIDLNEIVAARYESLGQEKVRRDYFRVDHTHTSPLGARLNAESVVQGLRLLKTCSLSQYLLDKPVVHDQTLSTQVIKLWPNGAPGALGSDVDDIPTLTPFLPTGKATGAAVVVCPGGGYTHLADHEGRPVAEWLNSIGITAFVLKYRIGPKYHHPAPLQDAARAIRTVRARASEWHLDPQRVGILGFSAGGHVASTIGTHFDSGNPTADDPIERVSSRPDLLVLIYPVITMGDFTHAGSKKQLIGA
ncbi:MAG TPA: alpha/beta hydrolase fold domain-containing protein, partial [Pyrinomonadaceae bacterium]|nr:alpha/beta hydrolase fold domain-containing protein [Pyrinomonadaceae bacterium]